MFDKPTLVALIGPPLLGKTTLGTEVARLLEVGFVDHEAHCRELFFGQFHGDPDANEEARKAFNTMQAAAYDILFDVVRGQLRLGNSLVVAATFVSAFSKENLIKVVADVPGAELRPILCWTERDPDEVVEARMKGRVGYAGAMYDLKTYRAQKARWIDESGNPKRPSPCFQLDTFPPYTVEECATAVIEELKKPLS